ARPGLHRGVRVRGRPLHRARREQLALGQHSHHGAWRGAVRHLPRDGLRSRERGRAHLAEPAFEPRWDSGPVPAAADRPADPAGGATVFYGQRYVGLGRLDTERDPVTQSWNAAINDEGILSDRVTDGIVDSTTGVRLDTLPLCSATQNGTLQPFFFGDLRSRC